MHNVVLHNIIIMKGHIATILQLKNLGLLPWIKKQFTINHISVLQLIRSMLF